MRLMYAIAALVTVLAGAVPSVAGQSASAQSPLDARVTIDYRGKPAADVVTTLSKAAGLAVVVAPGELLPVTIALTNVRLETALHAVCENASCRWALQHQTVTVTPLPVETGTLPRAISVALSDASVRDVLRALAATLNRQLTVEGELPAAPVNATFRNAPPDRVLTFVARAVRCSWELQPGRLIVRPLPQ